MQFELNHDKRNISDNDLLSDLRHVASKQSGHRLMQRTYKEQGQYGVTTVIRRFGSWNNALVAAGVELTVERNISNERLFEALYDLWVALGRQPSYSEVGNPSCRFHVGTYERRFGTWRRALENFVSYANSEELPLNPSTRETINVGISRTSRSADLRLRFKVLQRDRFCCCACGASPSTTPGTLLEIDHIIPWSKGGETKMNNLQTLCFSCNQGKSNQLETQLDT